MNPATAIEPNVKQAVPFFLVRSIHESLRFYVDGLGFTLKHQWVDAGKCRWCWIELGDAALMLQERSSDGHEGEPEGQVGVGVSIYFICQDALAIYREITTRGIQARRPFVGNRMWVTQVPDPDGYDILFESPTDVADETVLADDL